MCIVVVVERNGSSAGAKVIPCEDLICHPSSREGEVAGWHCKCGECIIIAINCAQAVYSFYPEMIGCACCNSFDFRFKSQWRRTFDAVGHGDNRISISGIRAKFKADLCGKS